MVLSIPRGLSLKLESICEGFLVGSHVVSQVLSEIDQSVSIATLSKENFLWTGYHDIHPSAECAYLYEDLSILCVHFRMFANCEGM